MMFRLSNRSGKTVRRNPSRKLVFQMLHRRELLAGDLHNAYLPADVNSDLVLSPADLLEVIGGVADRHRSSRLGQTVELMPESQELFPDVDGNGIVTPNDILLVIEQLAEDPEAYVMRLAHDTAPGETTNNDRITSDLSLEGHINWPADSEVASRRAQLRVIEEDGDVSEIDLAEYADSDGYFLVPGDDIPKLGGFTPRNLRFQMVVNADGESIAKHSPTLDVRFDSSAPRYYLPEVIAGNAEVVGLTLYDDSGLAAESIENFRLRSISQSDGFVTNPDVQRSSEKKWKEYVRLETAIEPLAVDGLDETFAFFVDGVLEDVAGNVRKVEDGGLLHRDSSELVQPFASDEILEAIEPESGYAFSQDTPGVNPGQRIVVPAGYKVTFQRFHPTHHDLSKRITYRTFSGVGLNGYSATYEIKVPDDAVTGEIRDEAGFVSTIQIVPGEENVQLRRFNDGVIWDSRSFGRGAVHVNDGEGSLQYRFLTDEERASWHLTGVAPKFNAEETASWQKMTVDQQAEALQGFHELQIAGPGGVSTPFVLDAGLAGFSNSIQTIEPSSDGGTFWAAASGEVRQLDLESLETKTVFSQSELLRQNVGLRDRLDRTFVPRALQEVPGSGLTGVTELFSDIQILSEQTYLVVWMSSGTTDSAWVFDSESQTVVGALTQDIAGALGETDYLQAVYDATEEVWFRLRSDLSFWEKRSPLNGEIVASGQPLELPTLLSSDASYLQGHTVHWDHVSQQVALKLSYLVRTIFSSRPHRYYALETDENRFTPVGTFQSHRSFYTSVDTDNADKAYYRYEFDGRSLIERERIDAESFFGELPSTAVDGESDVEPNVTQFAPVAKLGVPTDSAKPSANVAQVVEILGENLDSRLRMHFPTARIDNYDDWQSSIAPMDVSQDGKMARFRIPNTAISGNYFFSVDDDPIQDDFTRFDLQIVPHLELNQSDLLSSRLGLSADEPLRRYQNYFRHGTQSDAYRILVDDKIVDGCRDESLLESCEVSVIRREAWSAEETIVLETNSGRHTLSFDTREIVDQPAYRIDRISHSDSSPFTALQYDRLAPDQALTNSYIYFSVDKNPEASPADESELPTRFLLLTEDSDGQGLNIFRRVGGTPSPGHGYCIRLPLDFPGGWIVPDGVAARTVEIAESLGQRIEVVPTVIAATGDSRRPGSNLILFGVNLDKTQVSIDGVEVDVTPVREQPANSPLEFFSLVVPTSVTQGKIEITSSSTRSQLDRLLPWWLPDQMPVAEFGQPTFDDLPSINPGQSVLFDFDKTLPDGTRNSITELHTWSSRVSRRSTSNQHPAEDPSDVGQFVPAVRYGGSVFGDRSRGLLNIIPGLNGVDRSVPDELSDAAGGLAFVTSSFQTLVPNSTIRWDDNRWEFVTNESILPQIGNGDDRLFRGSGYVSGDRFSYWAIAAEASAPFTDDAVTIENIWGTTVIDLVNSPGPIFSDLVATSGTPDDPSLPSVNPWQSIGAGNGFIVPTSLGEQRSSGIRLFSSRRIPMEAVTGEFVAWGSDLREFVQVVPTMSGYTTNRPGIYYLFFKGVEATSQIQAESSIPLTETEIRQGWMKVDLSDARFESLSTQQLANGVTVTSRGGTSRAVLFD